MTWAFKRQIFYTLVFVLFLIIFASFIVYPKLNKAPSCVDGKQNGTETGVDCGGSCSKACLSDVSPLSVLWVRSFEVVPGRFNAVAYIENPNKGEAIQKLSYRFRFADDKNIYIGKREGSTFVPPSGRFAIFEPALDMGHSVPVFTTIEFTSTPVWIQVPQEKLDQLKISTSDISLQDTDTSPRLSAMVKNKSLFTIPNLNVVAIVYDAAHNAISVSRTYIDEIKGEQSQEVDFTWPQAFTTPPVATEIIPMFNVFSATLK
jgi:hypothetical protein